MGRSLDLSVRGHLCYVCELLRHKGLVYLEGRKLGLGVWQLLLHDASKILPDEWLPAVRGDYGHATSDAQALARHYRRNPHHPQHWLHSGEPTPMPDRYRREMLADWRAVGRVRGGADTATSTAQWYAKNGHRYPLHAETRAWLEAQFALSPTADGRACSGVE